MAEYVKILRDKIDPSLHLGIGDLPYKNKTIDNQVLDITALKADTGFAPRYTFEQGIELTINYFKHLRTK
jgi:nucleoside-diphosphate-sugar epimerase